LELKSPVKAPLIVSLLSPLVQTTSTMVVSFASGFDHRLRAVATIGRHQDLVVVADANFDRAHAGSDTDGRDLPKSGLPLRDLLGHSRRRGQNDKGSGNCSVNRTMFSRHAILLMTLERPLLHSRSAT
jgi:hypothetical protein